MKFLNTWISTQIGVYPYAQPFGPHKQCQWVVLMITFPSGWIHLRTASCLSRFWLELSTSYLMKKFQHSFYNFEQCKSFFIFGSTRANETYASCISGLGGRANTIYIRCSTLQFAYHKAPDNLCAYWFFLLVASFKLECIHQGDLNETLWLLITWAIWLGFTDRRRKQRQRKEHRTESIV